MSNDRGPDPVLHREPGDDGAACTDQRQYFALARAEHLDLRHSYASWLITSGVPVPDVQRVMGQSGRQRR